jgi:hypothetical protein
LQVGRRVAPCYLPGVATRSFAWLVGAAFVAAAAVALALLVRSPPPDAPVLAAPRVVAPADDSSRAPPWPPRADGASPVAPASRVEAGEEVFDEVPVELEQAPRTEGGEDAEPLPRIPPPHELEPASALAARRHEVMRLYGRGDFEAAIGAALEYLEDDPDDRVALRIATTSACILGERVRAAELHRLLDPDDQVVAREHCERHGVTL